jgi:sugar lactone lactonase YvrE
VTVSVHPQWALPGSSVLVRGRDLPVGSDGPPLARVAGHDAHVLAASARRVRVVVPAEVDGGPAEVRVDGVTDGLWVEVASVLATGLHQVDSPAFDRDGRLYVTQSGGPGSKVSVPIYRLTRDGIREPVAVEVANPTGLALGPDGAMYISSRFERTVYRLDANDRLEVYAADLGVPTGLAFSPDGALYVGDRSGSILRVSPGREVETFASLPASVAAFHLAFGPDACLYVAGPTLSSRDVVYRISPDRVVDTAADGFGRPQGLAFDRAGYLYVVEALAGSAALYRVDVRTPGVEPELVLTAPALIGVAFDPDGGIALASNDTVWRLAVGLKPYLLSSN